MQKNNDAQPPRELNSETADELVGVLTAISVVSKRLARRLVLLDDSGKGDTVDEKREHSVSKDAD